MEGESLKASSFPLLKHIILPKMAGTCAAVGNRSTVYLLTFLALCSKSVTQFLHKWVMKISASYYINKNIAKRLNALEAQRTPLHSSIVLTFTE